MLEMTGTTSIRDPLLLAYEERLRRLRRDPKTIKQYRQTARKYQELLDDLGTTADKVPAIEIEEWLGSLDLMASTKHSHLARLRWAYTAALRRGQVTVNPTYEVMIERVPDTAPIIIPNSGLRRIKDEATTDREWAAFHLLTYAGLRRCETILLRWQDIRWESQDMEVIGKGGKLRHIPLHPALAEALFRMERKHERVLAPRRGGRSIGGDTWDAMLKSLTRGDWTAHDFRRTAASSLALNEVPDPLIDEIMGWSTRKVGRRYYIRVAPAQLQRAIMKLYADDPL